LTKNEREKVQILAVSIDSREDSKKFLQKLKERFAGDLDFPSLKIKTIKSSTAMGFLILMARAGRIRPPMSSTSRGWCAGALSRSTIEKGPPMSRSWRR